MKVLMIDKYFFVKGGAERYFFELSKVLEDNGHEVIPFAMAHPDNFASDYASFFASNIEYNSHGPGGKVSTFFKATGRMIYSFEAKNKLDALIRTTRPDIAHLHMIDHQLSPSILHTLKKHGIPVLQTVHQYKLVCPNYRLYNPLTGKICEKCMSGNFLHPIKEKCHKGSAIAGLMVAAESSLHRWSGIYEKNIDLFHVPSHFMGKKFQEAGVGNGKVRHLFYTINISDFEPKYAPGDYMLYFGRLADEKGILTLLRSASARPEIPFHIVGDGPQRPILETFVKENKLENVRFLGLKSGEELKDCVCNARAVLVPSEWFDNSPLVIYESFAYGKPVIASRMGGMPELIDQNKNGFLFNAGDADALGGLCQVLWDSAELSEKFGRAARAKAEQEFEPQVHYEKMFSWYEELVAG
jgi:glycosyltransferase involved in cell wall biosynthesis